MNEIKGYVSLHGYVKAGKNAVTQSGTLPASCIIHVSGPPRTPGFFENMRIIDLHNCVFNAMDRAYELGCQSICFPDL